MKTIEDYLDLQAHADGELVPTRRAEVEQRIATDPEARAIVNELRSVRELVRAHEPLHVVPESREFYWSQIRRRMDQSESATERPSSPAPTGAGGRWLRWLVPTFGMAALVVALTLTSSRPGATKSADNLASETGSDASGAVMFRSDSEGVTICWLD